jgi:iron-sulfur cluster repair protein YtfE (RIC family)
MTDSLAAALEREHHEIDEGIAAFSAEPGDRRPLTRAIRALRRHIYLEEEFLFPQLYQAQPGLAAPVFVMLREHGQIWALMDSLALLGADADGLAVTRQLTSHLLHHNRKEEKVLYPLADETLPAAEAERLRTFIDAGELPDGWVCFKARDTQEP